MKPRLAASHPSPAPAPKPRKAPEAGAGVALASRPTMGPRAAGAVAVKSYEAELERTFGAVRIDSPKFGLWLGKSGVVHPDGTPMKVFHGTKGVFTAFDPKKMGQSDPGLLGPAFYFTPCGSQAGNFAESPHYGGRGGAPSVVPLYLSIQNPAYIVDGILPDGRSLSEAHPHGISVQSGRALKAALIKAGHDGAIFKDGSGEVVQVVAFRPTQIKSALTNSGDFDPENPDIRS